MTNYDRDEEEPLNLRHAWARYIWRFAFLFIMSFIFLRASHGWTHTFWLWVFGIVVVGHLIQLPVILYMIWYVKRHKEEREHGF